MKQLSFILIVLTVSLRLWAAEGALSGRFTINAQGEQIVFAQGNLQYQPSTGTWRLADSQLSVLGEANADITTATYSGWLDLFGWGTGVNPTNYSTDWQDYPTYNEWGQNAISNAGNTANLWRTLTANEWNYIFFKRNDAAKLFGLGQVGGVNGLIILPDSWSLPADVTFHPSTQQGLKAKSDYYANTDGKNFGHNNFTLEQWSVLEAAGAVFLPAAGYRWDNEVYMLDSDLGSLGYYWSSTPEDNWKGYCLYFDAYELSPQNTNSRIYGLAVRLVRKADIHTAVECTTADLRVTKRLINGQLIIEKNGIQYNTTGMQIK